jgi:ribosomal protein L11 methylase PrmA
VDLDAGAVAATAANAAANGVDVDARTGSAGDVEGRFDLVLANIGASTIVELAPVLAARTAGRLVVAGFNGSRAADVALALAAAGRPVVERQDDAGWSCLTA